MIKLSSVASILFGIAWLVPSRADELADQPIAGADRSREIASAQPSTTKARPSRPQGAFVPMDFKRMFTAGPLSDPQPPSKLLPAGAVTVDLTLRAATPTLCRYSVAKDLPFDQMTPFDTAAPSSSPRTIVRGLDADPGRVNDVHIRSAAAPSAALHLQYRSLPAPKPGFPRTANLWASWRFLSGFVIYEDEVNLAGIGAARAPLILSLVAAACTGFKSNPSPARVLAPTAPNPR